MHKKYLLKISGEYLKDGDNVFSASSLENLYDQIKEVLEKGNQLAIVIGGGNIFRGRTSLDYSIDSISGDQIGMISTTLNTLLLSSYLKNKEIDNIVYSKINIKNIFRNIPYFCLKRKFNRGKLIIFSGGTGKVGFSTDTAAALHARRLGVDKLLFAKFNVEGIFDVDPRINENAKMFKEITYEKIISLNLKVMDIESVKILKDTKIETRVFNIARKNAIIDTVNEEDIGTLVRSEN